MAISRGKQYSDGPKAVGKRLRRVREYAGLSQRQLANKTSVTAAYISRIEAGARNASFQVIDELAEHLPVPTAYLVQGWRPPFDTKQRAIWILEVFGDASDDELKQIKLHNPPKMAHKRLPWLLQNLISRGRPVLATNAKKVYDLRFSGERR